MTRRSLLGDESGQGHTLEALAAGFLLLASVAFALQMTAVTPLSASTSSQHLENQLRFTGAGVLASAQDAGTLSEAVRYWNESGARFHDAPDGGAYANAPPENALGRSLQRSYDDRNVAYNVYLVYETDSGSVEREPMIYRGEPSDHAVRASRTVIVFDDEPLVDEDETANETESVTSSSTYFLPDSAPGQDIRNVVRVEVVAWRL